jgi:RNA polymerase sigma factor (sigma-70 family)
VSLSSERTALYRTHRGALVDYASDIVGNRTQAEDVVQEAWLRLDDATRQRAIADPLRYLYRIVRNLALDMLRRAHFEQRTMGLDVESVAEVLPDDRPAADTHLIASAELEAMLAALRELPDRTRIAFEMHRLGGYKLKEIATHLGISIGLVHALVAEAIAHCSERRSRRQ